MNKLLYLLIFITSTAMAQGSFYDFKMASIDGETIDFSKYKGQKVLIVNTASECGYTPQYEDLQALHEQFGGKVTVLGFPANNFGGQEPGSNLQIAQFCKKNYGVSFQLFEKIDVTGKDRAPLYAWLEKQSGKVPTWNFCKYLIDENGKVVQFFPSAVNPMDEQVTGLL
ncbi:glutathione peroxidase [Imperialibacter roseus]|uniref:Glutathione peroxidase n=1 Tax=Imperialibacter roseus TaxID=1324217 RepID=A0ABZ0ISN0_9BACT|nr:glutathione peroxidase [Imperialibacter roseus]WOK08053.1 glutathione peroxidase [Imperialibacter roseus]